MPHVVEANTNSKRSLEKQVRTTNDVQCRTPCVRLCVHVRACVRVRARALCLVCCALRQLKSVCEEFILMATRRSIEPLLSFLAKARPAAAPSRCSAPNPVPPARSARGAMHTTPLLRAHHQTVPMLRRSHHAAPRRAAPCHGVPGRQANALTSVGNLSLRSQPFCDADALRKMLREVRSPDPAHKRAPSHCCTEQYGRMHSPAQHTLLSTPAGAYEDARMRRARQELRCAHGTWISRRLFLALCCSCVSHT